MPLLVILIMVSNLIVCYMTLLLLIIMIPMKGLVAGHCFESSGISSSPLSVYGLISPVPLQHDADETSVRNKETDGQAEREE